MKNQINFVLPRSAWEKVSINENHEPLVGLIETDKLKIGVGFKNYKPSFFVRKTVAEKLYRASDLLPDEYRLLFIEGHRSMESQKYEWDCVFNEIKKKNPLLLDEEIERQVRLIVAKPSPLANHYCGGAVDVTLIYENEIVDMGTPYISKATMEDRFKFSMFSEEITWNQNRNRQILRDAMETEDFVWYPGEWWHYCWGDRMWAVYSNQTQCHYGPIEQKADL